MKTAEDLSPSDLKRINAYLLKDRRGQRVANPREATVGYALFDRRAGSIALAWLSHEARCQAMGITFGSDGPYNRPPSEPMMVPQEPAEP